MFYKMYLPVARLGGVVMSHVGAPSIREKGRLELIQQVHPQIRRMSHEQVRLNL